MSESPTPAAEGGGRGRLGRSLLFGAVFGLVVLAALAAWADVRGVGAALARFPLHVAGIACALSFANYGLRFLRWQRYLHLLGIRIPAGTSYLISLAGLAFTVSPGKLGEAYKSWLVKRVHGAPVHVTAPIVLAERFTDLLAFLVLIAIGGLGTSPDHAWIFWAVLAGCGVLLAFATSIALQEFALGFAGRMPVVSKLVPRVRASLATVRSLLSPRQLVLPTLLATAGWGLECVGFWLVADAFAPGAISLSFAAYTFALSAVAGAVLILFPGGLGPTEASMSALVAPRYVAAGLSAEAARASAASATLVIRLCTLWFAVAVGALAALIFQRRFRRDPDPAQDRA
ncbi:MAG: lysylphosphatidylglycerol synthase transmembrane domain-containing protein [Planctomycetota bacterium]|nr:lysylphosphatidylglycerol synthase transmembrane domain-containing protein [Planctomycetota bacterium]